MATSALNAVSSPSSFKTHKAAGEVAVALYSQQRALYPLSSIQSHSGRTLNFPVASKRGVSVGNRPWVVRGKRSISSVVAQVAGAAAATTEISPGKWESGESYFFTDSRPVILFDGVCNMCNGGVNFMLDNDKEGKMRFAALQSEAGRMLLIKSGRAPDDISSIVLVGKDRSFIKSEAILQIGQCLDFPYSPAAFLGLLVPMFLRDALYDTVSDNRYSVFGKTKVCRLSDPRFAERFID